MTKTSLVVSIAAVGLIAGTAGTAVAQPLGQYRWQQQPYCNVVTLNVVQAAGVYQLDGFDDQCGGANPRAAVVGTAFLNPDGSVGMGLTIVAAPAATPVQIHATLNPISINGTWTDNSGITGSFVFTPGAPVPGNPRPAPRAVFPAGISVGGTTITNVGPPAAPSDAANRGYVDGIAATKADATAVSLVLRMNNVGVDNAFVFPTPQATFGATTFTTPRSAHLLISMHVTGNIDCVGTDIVYWWIELDGTPIRSSVRLLGGGGGFSAAGFPPVTMEGTTPSPVAAGAHNVNIRASCTAGTWSGITSSSIFTGSVTLLDDGFATRLSPAAALDTPASLACSVVIENGVERRTCQ